MVSSATVLYTPKCIHSIPVVHGIFLVDSFADMNEEGVEYMTTLLEYLFLRYGLVCIAVVRGGAKVKQYKDMVAFAEASLVSLRPVGYLPRDPEFVVIISMGNDVYRMALQELFYDHSLAEWVSDTMNEVVQYAKGNLGQRVLVVYGGSSNMWRYEDFGGELYDRYVDTIVKRLRGYGIYVIRGIRLGRPELLDKIGHVSVVSFPEVIHEYCYWVYLVCGGEMRSRGLTRFAKL